MAAKLYWNGFERRQEGQSQGYDWLLQASQNSQIQVLE